VYIIIHYIIQM